MRKANLVTGTLLLWVALFFAYHSKKLIYNVPGAGLGPGMVPFWFALTLGVLSCLLITFNLGRNGGNSQEITITWGELLGIAILYVFMITYVLSMPFLGFGTATFIFLTFITNLLGKYPWWKCGCFGLIVALFIVLVFRSFLGLPLYRGLIGF